MEAPLTAPVSFARPARPAAGRGIARLSPLLAFALALAACAEVEPAPPPSDADREAETAPVVEPLRAETAEGPVTAAVSLAPASPRLGDPLVLTLEVKAAAGVTVEMPAFGDALGRFAIVDFAPRREETADGVLSAQRYTLQVSASGRHRIPRLRVEFVDERDGRDPKPRELLTDELGFQVASVLPDGEAATELRPARPPLKELEGPWLRRHWPWLAGGGGAAAALTAAVVMWLRRAEQRARLTAFDRAVARLERLRRAGLPEQSGMDAWYVELSDIVRRYIEERFALRAPEQTTEEFLLEAGRSALSRPHRELLSAFLETCDRVKFARYSPGARESQQALDEARRFLDETRAVDAGRRAAADEPTPATAGARATR